MRGPRVRLRRTERSRDPPMTDGHEEPQEQSEANEVAQFNISSTTASYHPTALGRLAPSISMRLPTTFLSLLCKDRSYRHVVSSPQPASAGLSRPGILVAEDALVTLLLHRSSPCFQSETLCLPLSFFICAVFSYNLSVLCSINSACVLLAPSEAIAEPFGSHRRQSVARQLSSTISPLLAALSQP